MSYPWKDMPLRKIIDSPYTEFPGVLQTAMTPLVALQRIVSIVRIQLREQSVDNLTNLVTRK